MKNQKISMGMDLTIWDDIVIEGLIEERKRDPDKADDIASLIVKIALSRIFVK
jgi:hypothetical protein